METLFNYDALRLNIAQKNPVRLFQSQINRIPLIWFWLQPCSNW